MPAHTIHPTSIVDPSAELGEGVRIGPWCHIGPGVKLGEGVELRGSVWLQGPLTIGAGSVLYPHVCVGMEPQDVKFKPGHPTAGVLVGKNGILREHVTIHAASKTERATTIGDNVFMLAGSHVGHDCQVGNNVTFVNGAAIGGHVQLGDNVLLGGFAVVHQFCRIGRLAMLGGSSAISQDLPPFCTSAIPNRTTNINRVGLRRSGMPRDQITAIWNAYREVLRDPPPREAAVAELTRRAETCPPIRELAEFVASTKRGIVPGLGRPTRESVAWLRTAWRDESDGSTNSRLRALLAADAEDDEQH